MTALLDLLTDKFGGYGPLYLVAGIVMALMLLAIPMIVQKREDPLDRLKQSVRSHDAGRQKAKLRQGTGKDKLEKYSNFLEPQNEDEFSAIQLKLLQAGYRTKNAVRVYYFFQFALGIGALIAGVAYAILKTQTGDPSTQDTMLAILIPGAVGYMAPKYWVTRRQAERQDAIVNGFPDSLDMLLVCIEAGQSLDQAILRVARELRAGFSELAEEFEIVSYELKAGKDRTQVMRDMAERCGVPDVNSFVTVLIQSQQFGTSIAEALRVYAGEMRDKRVMRAEEKANTLPTKMTLATMMLTVPPLLIILIGPSVYGIMTFMSMGGN